MITVTFNGDEDIIKSDQSVYQWDTGQKVTINGLSDSSINYIHFSFKGLKTAYVVGATNTSGTITVIIPNIVLRYGKDVYMYLCIRNSNGNVVTVKTVIIPVIKRNMPENYMYDDDETVATSLDELQAEIQRSTAVDTDHETRITSLEEAKTNASGTTFETLKGRIDYDINDINGNLTEISEREKSNNLFNVAEAKENVIFDDNGADTDNADYFSSGLIHVEAGKTVYFYCSQSQTIADYGRKSFNSIRTIALDKDLKKVGNTSYGAISNYTVPDGAKYIRFATWKSLIKNFISVEYSSNPGKYEEYKNELNIKYEALPDRIIDEVNKVVTAYSIDNNELDLNSLEDLSITENATVIGYNTSTFLPIISTTASNVSGYNVLDFKLPQNQILKWKMPASGTPSNANRYILYNSGSKALNITTSNLKPDENGMITVDCNARILQGFERIALVIKASDNLYGNDFFLKKSDYDKDKKEDEEVKQPLFTDISMFNSVGAIGDSYTHGDCTNSSGTWVTTGASWIKTMAQRAGVEYGNYGQGGLTCKQYNTNTALNANPHDMYFYAMGINDSEKLYDSDTETIPTDHLGTIDDIKSDYTQNGETFYGYYGKIISQMMEHAPNAKHCMILIPITGGYKEQFNNAIIEIANHFGIPYINPFDDPFFTSDIYNAKASGHPTRMGFVGMGLAYERLFSKVVEKNPAYFKYAVIN